jgi:hypothetical protein
MRHWWWLCLLPALCWAEPLKLAVPGLSVVDVDSQRSSFLTEHLAQQLSDEGAQVVSAQDLTVMLGLDRQRQLMGCTGGKCVTELTSTLGVDALVTGDVARLSGERFQLNLRMLDASTGQRVRTYTKRVIGFENLLDEMSKAAKTLVNSGNKKFGRTSSEQNPAPPPRVASPAQQPSSKPAPMAEPLATAPAPEPADSAPYSEPAVSVSRAPSQGTSLRKWAWIPAAAGGLTLGGGLYFFLGSEGKYKQLTDGAPRTRDEAGQLRDDGKRQQNLARVGMGVGTALLLAGGGMALLGPAPVEPQVSLGREHVSLGVAGVLPW